jgi:hypothetical protein
MAGPDFQGSLFELPLLPPLLVCVTVTSNVRIADSYHVSFIVAGLHLVALAKLALAPKSS